MELTKEELEGLKPDSPWQLYAACTAGEYGNRHRLRLLWKVQSVVIYRVSHGDDTLYEGSDPEKAADAFNKKAKE